MLVHVHDVFWPADYPDEWIFERGQTWNEQYVLQAFLMYNRSFEIMVCTAALGQAATDGAVRTSAWNGCSCKRGECLACTQ